MEQPRGRRARDNIHKNFLDNLLSCMPLIANFTTRGFHENCLINEKSASVCREIVFLKTSRFVLSLCGYLTLVVVQLKSFIFRCQIFRYGVILDFRQVGETRDTTRGLLAFLNKLGIPFLSPYLIPLCKAF